MDGPLSYSINGLPQEIDHDKKLQKLGLFKMFLNDSKNLCFKLRNGTSRFFNADFQNLLRLRFEIF